MQDPICAITADNHLRANVWSKHPEIYGDAYESFQQIINTCLNRQLPLVLLGDTFDNSHPDSRDIVFFSQCMTMMRGNNLPVYYIQGNHDLASPGWPSIHPHCIAVDSTQFSLGPFTCYGLDFRKATELRDALASIPVDEIDLLFTHQSWVEIQKVGSTDAAFTDLPPVKDKKKTPLVLVTGDYHVHGVFQGLNADGMTQVAYSPGSTCMQKINEQSDKFFCLLYDEDHYPLFESQPLKTRRCYTFNCRDEAEFSRDLEAARKLISAEPDESLPYTLQKPLLRIRYDDRIQDAYARMRYVVADQAHLFDEPQHTIDTTEIAQSDTPIAAFENLLSAVSHLAEVSHIDSAGLQSLLRANDPKKEIAALFKDYLATTSTALEKPGEN